MDATQFLPEVQKVLERDGEPAYRLGQAYSALTGSLVRDWEEATSLPQSLRETLNEEAPAAVLDLQAHLEGLGRDEEVPVLHPRRPRHRDGHDPREGPPHRLHLHPGRVPDGLQILRHGTSRHQTQPEDA